LMFSAVMQAPRLRVDSCSARPRRKALRGHHQCGAGDTCLRAGRGAPCRRSLLAGVAAQESGDPQMARGCFGRVLATPAASGFPELRTRRERRGHDGAASRPSPRGRGGGRCATGLARSASPASLGGGRRVPQDDARRCFSPITASEHSTWLSITSGGLCPSPNPCSPTASISPYPDS
jgi:hypothetical protein